MEQRGQQGRTGTAEARAPLANTKDQPEDFGEATDFGIRQLLGYYEQRRSYPRVDLRVPVLITTESRQVLRARTRNLSADGLQLRCDRPTAKALHPKGTQILPGAGPSVLLRLELPFEGKTRPFVAAGKLTYISASRRDEIAFGVQFAPLQPRDKALLEAFLMQALSPRETGA